MARTADNEGNITEYNYKDKANPNYVPPKPAPKKPAKKKATKDDRRSTSTPRGPTAQEILARKLKAIDAESKPTGPGTLPWRPLPPPEAAGSANAAERRKDAQRGAGPSYETAPTKPRKPLGPANPKQPAPAVTGSSSAADYREAWKRPPKPGAPQFIGPDGQPIKPGSQAAKVAGKDGVATNPLTGEWVWMGPAKTKDEWGRPNTTDQFLQKDAAYNDINGWSDGDVKAFQKIVGAYTTGVVDDFTLKKWRELVDISVRHTQAGRKMTPMQALMLRYGRSKGGGSGGGGSGGRGGRRGGGGGGGGGGGSVNHSQAKALLNAVMQKEAGREATDAEVTAFRGALSGAIASGVDPEQYAIDWIRGRSGTTTEAGSYQAATNYYEAAMAALSGGSVAAAAAGGGS